MRDTGRAAVAVAIATFAAIACDATPVAAAQWYTIDAAKAECKRASQTEFPTPDDLMDYLQQRNRYRSRQVTRDFTGRAQIVTFTDIDNRQTVFFVDEETCQQALRRTRDRQRFGDRG